MENGSNLDATKEGKVNNIMNLLEMWIFLSLKLDLEDVKPCLIIISDIHFHFIFQWDWAIGIVLIIQL